MKNIKKVEKLITQLGFSPFSPSVALMDGLRKAPAAQRCGLYVHAFKGGREFYVGISVDVRKRYQQHLKYWPDIEFSAYLPMAASEQFLNEFSLIGDLMRQGISLRNTLRPDQNFSKEEVDAIIHELTSLAYADGGMEVDSKVRHAADPALRKSLTPNHPMVKKYTTMLEHELYEPCVSRIFAKYVRTCIPLPTLTERNFWIVTCMNNGLYPKPFEKLKVLVRISVNHPEVFSAVIDTTGKKPVLGYNILVAAEAIDPATFESIRKMKGVDYMSNFQKGIKLKLHQFIVRSHESMEAMLAIPNFRAAARLHNLLLMRKGQNHSRRTSYHNLPLADHLFQEKVKV
jgi:hypothetical protein